MASLISYATGDFTHSSNTWKVVQSVGEIDLENGTVNISTSNIDSPTFVPTNTAHDGVALKISSKLTTGTFTVTLRNSTTSTDAQAVTVNVTDLPSLGWVFFKFGSSHTPNGTDSYIVRSVCSTTGNQVVLYRSTSGTNNVSKKLRTTTTAAPGANDHLVITGERTGAGTGNSFTVTMDNTATTTWGPSSVGTQGVFVGQGGTLTFGTTSSTNYYFRWRGIFLICSGGVLNVGTSGTPMPSTSSAILEMNCVTGGDSKLQRGDGGTIGIYCHDKTVRTTLTADVAVAATVLPVVSTSGWQVGDQLGIAGTNAGNQFERRTILTVDSSTQVTLTASLTNAHKGTGLVIASIMNLTRNIKIQSNSTSNRGNVLILPGGSGTVYISAEFVADTVGHANSTNNRMLEMQNTATPATTIKKCSINPGTPGAGNNNMGFYVSSATADNFDFDEVLNYNYIRPTITVASATTGTNWYVRNCIGFGQTEGNGMYDINSCLGQVLNNEAWQASSTSGISYTNLNTSWSMTDSSRFANNRAYFCTVGFYLWQTNTGSGCSRLSITGNKTYRTAGIGILIDGFFGRVDIDNHYGVGNAHNNNKSGDIATRTGVGTVTVTNSTFAGETSTYQPQYFFINNVSLGSTRSIRVQLQNCSIGVVDAPTGLAAYTQAVSFLSLPEQSYLQIEANNCNFGNSTLIGGGTSTYQQLLGDHIDKAASYFRSQKHGQTAGDHRTYVPQGVIKTDTAIYHTDSPAERLTPNSATYKLRGSPAYTPVASGGFTTVKVWIRKSASGDGAAYNGNQPRLVLSRTDALGVTSNQVLATASGSTGSWEQLSGTTPTATDDGIFQVYVDCDGTAGWVNVDDWSQ